LRLSAITDAAAQAFSRLSHYATIYSSGVFTRYFASHTGASLLDFHHFELAALAAIS